MLKMQRLSRSVGRWRALLGVRSSDPSMLRLLCALLSANAVVAVRPYNGMEGQRAHVAWQISVALRC